MLRSIMKLAKNRKMIKVNPMTEVEPIRYKVKGFKDWSNVEIELFRLGPERVSGGRLAYRQKKTGAEIDIPVVPHLKLRLRRSLRCQSGNSFLRRNSAKPSPRGFYNWFTDKARKAGVPKGRSPHGLRKACCRRLAEAGCSPHENMSVSGHETLKEVEHYTKAANNRGWPTAPWQP